MCVFVCVRYWPKNAGHLDAERADARARAISEWRSGGDALTRIVRSHRKRRVVAMDATSARARAILLAAVAATAASTVDLVGVALCIRIDMFFFSCVCMLTGF